MYYLKSFFVLLVALLFLVTCAENKQASIPSGDKYEDYQKYFIGEEFASIFELNPLFDFDNAVAKALDENKPLLLFFAIINDSGGGLKENMLKLLATNEAIDFIKGNYITTILFTDDKLKKDKEDNLNIGEVNQNIAYDLGYFIHPPFYLIVDSERKQACSSYEELILDFEKFYKFLKENTDCGK